MEVSNALLVALMFVTILSIGIGNILMGFATMLDPRTALRISRLHGNWVVLILLVYLRLFWNTLEILSTAWEFTGFLYVMPARSCCCSRLTRCSRMSPLGRALTCASRTSR